MQQEEYKAAAYQSYSEAYEELMDLIYEFAQKSTFNSNKQPMQAVNLIGLQEISNKIDEVIRLGYRAQGVHETLQYYDDENNSNSQIKERMDRPLRIPVNLFEAFRI